MDRTVHRGYLGLNVGNETFTDLDFADDVSLLASMLEIVVLIGSRNTARGVITTWFGDQLDQNQNTSFR